MGLIVAAPVTQQANDERLLQPMLTKGRANCGRLPEKVSMDPGYFNTMHLTDKTLSSVDLFVSPDRQRHGMGLKASVAARAANVWTRLARWGPRARSCLAGGWVRLKRAETIDFSNFTLCPGGVSVSGNHSWYQCADRFDGNVAHVSAGAPDGEDRVHTHTTYACRDDARGYNVDKPVYVQVRDAPDAVTLEENWFLYEGLGNLEKSNITRSKSWMDQWTSANLCTAVGGKRCVRTTMGTMSLATSPR